MIFALVGHKGGVGRTTLALHLAATAQRAGRRTLLLDATRDRTLLAMALRRNNGLPTVLRLEPTDLRRDPARQRSLIQDLAFGHDLTLVDCSAADEETMRRVLEAADVALVPCTPSPLDAWTLSDTFDLVSQVGSSNPRLIASVLLNRVDPRTALGRDAGDQLRQHGLPVLGHAIRQRIAYAEAMAESAPLHELDPEASEDLQRVLVALLGMAREAAAELVADAPQH